MSESLNDGFKTARENVRTNGVQGIFDTTCGSLEDVTGQYDLVVVNILARIIVEMMCEGLGTRVRPGGKIIAAGIILDQESDVTATMEQAGLTLVDRRQRDDWVCLVAGLPEGKSA